MFPLAKAVKAMGINMFVFRCTGVLHKVLRLLTGHNPRLSRSECLLELKLKSSAQENGKHDLCSDGLLVLPIILTEMYHIH